MNIKQKIYIVLIVLFALGVLDWLGFPSSEPIFSLFGEPTLFKAIVIILIFIFLVIVLFKFNSKDKKSKKTSSY